MDVDIVRKDFMVVHLNGLVQTDDRMALKEIMRQLSREGESELGESNVSILATWPFTLVCWERLPSNVIFLRNGSTNI